MGSSLSYEITRSRALTLILLFGVVSLLADITYEGARSAIPTYLGILGATAAITTFIGGLGDFIAQAPRFLVGILIHITGKYWLFTFIGYALTLIAIPLLGLAGRWELAAALIILDRLGKALRSPARNALFSGVSKRVGHGLGFGIAELLDQIGAIAGPFYMAMALLFGASFSIAFIALFLPSIAALSALYFTYIKYPRGIEIREKPQSLSEGIHKLDKKYWLFITIVTLSTLGLLHIYPMLYRAGELEVAPGWSIPLLYLVAMGIDAIIAIPAGILYDKIGLKILYIIYPSVIAIPLSITIMGATWYGFLIAAIFYGIVIGIHESALRAGVASLTYAETRGLAYGFFSALYGLAILISSIVVAILYPNFFAITIYATILQIISAILLTKTMST